MSKRVTKYGAYAERIDFSRIKSSFELPDLTEVQTSSFKWFITEGIKEVFEDISPIENFTGTLSLEFGDFSFGEPNYPVQECKDREVTYIRPLKVWVRLFNNETGEVKEQEVFMGDIPWMTEHGSFIINGAERVVVSQLVRSPSVYLGLEVDKNGRKVITSSVIPNRGTWLEFEIDAKDIIYVRIDRNRKILATVLLRALGLSNNEDILELFGDHENLKLTLEKDPITNSDEALVEIYEKLRPGEPATIESSKNLMVTRFFDEIRYDLSHVGRYKFNKKLNVLERVLNHTLASDIKLEKKTLAVKGDTVTKSLIEKLTPYIDRKVLATDLEIKGKLIAPKESILTKEIVNKLKSSVDKEFTKDFIFKEEVLVKKNTVMTNEIIESLPSYFASDFGVDAKYNEDLDTYNRIQIIDIYSPTDKKKVIRVIGNDQTLDIRRITISDIYATFSYYLNILEGIGIIDEIDHLGNRRVRQVGELIQNQFRIGLSRVARAIKDKMSTQDIESVTPKTLINVRPIIGIMNEFFGSSQLSQFMDQTNPLSALTNKRRLSALGPGGLTRDRAGFEVRDVHYSHYGRICPIETPEGPNIGLITSLATYAKVSEYGFIKTPYKKVVKGKIIDEVEYLTADTEENFVIAEANVNSDEEGKILDKTVSARYRGETILVKPKEVDYIDVSPKQIVSVATSCIPFLEHDDANRALMGANMQRQALPLIRPHSPIVGTGMEYMAARYSGSAVIAEEDGVVEYVDARKIVVNTKKGKQTYNLINFARSNQATYITQRPLVKVGEKIKKGNIIADGPAMEKGELALGQNVLVAFTTWHGYNFEDAIVINEKLVMDDVYTSIHIEKYEISARDTKLGPEEITRDIPNVGDEARKNLDSTGIIRIGSEVRSGDILVGKVTPKGVTELSSEEKLLHAIFGEKTREVRDTSLCVPHGGDGIVHDVKVYSRKNGDELPAGVNMQVQVFIAQKRKIGVGDKMAGRHGNKGVISVVLPEEDMPFLADGTPVDICLNPQGVPSRMNIGQVLELHLGMAGRKLGVKFASPVFDGAEPKEVFELLEKAGIDKDGKTVLYDGLTGKPFENRIAVGVMYMLKLVHMVDDKIHARSTGNYALVTQQPLGGKAQFGGQRFGEMEVWALEAYGVAHTLQELLTLKSDDVIGRVKLFEALVRGKELNRPGVPESFRVLIKELQALALDVNLYTEDGKVDFKKVEEMEHAEEDNFETEDIDIVNIDELQDVEENEEN